MSTFSRHENVDFSEQLPIMRASPPAVPIAAPIAIWGPASFLGSRFEAWHEVYVAEAEAEAAEETTQSGEPPQAPTNPEQAAILASLNVQRY
jgi:hypothetical protein